MVFEGGDFSVAFGGNRQVGLTETLRASFEAGTVTESIYKVVFKHHLLDMKLLDIMQAIEDAITAVINRLHQCYNPTDLVRVCIVAPNFHVPHSLELQPIRELTLNQILELLENILQSDEDLPLTDGFEIHVAVARNPLGRGRFSRGFHHFLTRECDIHKNRATVKITAEDNLCFARSVAVCLAKADLEEATEMGKGSPSYKKALRAYHSIIRRSRQFQKKKALRLQRKAGLPPSSGVMMTDIPRFERALKLRIVVFAPHVQNKVIYVGRLPSGDKRRRTIFLLFLKDDENEYGHFHPIVKLSAFFRHAGFFCPDCLTPVSKKSKHSCYSFCSLCQHTPCTYHPSQAATCPDCFRLTRSQACMTRHKAKQVCQEVTKCLHCTRVYKRSEGHECGTRTCHVCGKVVPVGLHYCTMRAKEPAPIGFNYIFADFEAQPNDRRHLANLVIAHWTCRHCIRTSYRQSPKCPHCGTGCDLCHGLIDKRLPRGHEDREVCMKTEGCGLRSVQYFGDQCATDFCKFVFSDSFTGYTLIFHNGQGYDFYFLMKFICEHGHQPTVFYRGSKIIAASLRGRLNIRLVDSLNFLAMPLSAMPKVFSLPDIGKGTFPFLFNKACNYDYVGPLPAPEYYGVDQMKPGAREDFLAWHLSQKDKTFDFMAELVAYCEVDVSILEEACLAFRELVIGMTAKEVEADLSEDGADLVTRTIGVDPLQYNTMAAVCMAIYRFLFLPEQHELTFKDGLTGLGTLVNGEWVAILDPHGKPVEVEVAKEMIEQSSFLHSPIARMPAGGFTATSTHSEISIHWLQYVSHKRGIRIRHALTDGGEFTLPNPKGYGRPLRVDGFCEETNTVFEFNGCLWHGCSKCYPYTSPAWCEDSTPEPYPLHPHTGQTMRELLLLTLQRQRYIQIELGYNLEVMWECDFHDLLESDESLKAFVKDHPVRPRLNPRDALFGGRTNASTLYRNVADTPNVKIAYGDITSLYPTVLKFDEFPVGLPEVILSPDSTSISDFFGIAFCRVRPPRALYHPVLPMKTKEGKLVFTLCKHCALTGSRTRCQCPDSQRDLEGTWCTVELQNAVSHGYAIVEIFEVYHFAQSSKGMFAGYVNMFVKGKQEASGWPKADMTEEEKQNYIRDYFEAEGIPLDPEKIALNPGARRINKQIANSLWGKFGELQDRRKHLIVNTAEGYYKQLTNPNITIKDVHVLAPNTLQMEYLHKTHATPECPYINTFVAVFTTAHARTRLYQQLAMLGRDVIYYDTDSIIYTYDSSSPNPKHPPYGDHLGEWTNELASGDHITEFVSAGPKSYAYLTHQGHDVVKIKGLTLNYSVRRDIHFDAIKALVKHYVYPDTFPLPPELGDLGEIPVSFPHKICRDRLKFKLYAKTLTKRFKVTYGKRQLLRDGSFDTIPFGF